MKVTKTEDGYYEVVLGRFTQDGNGRIYDSLKKRAKKGALWCELGAPRRQRGMSDLDFDMRRREIHDQNACAAIMDIVPAADGKSLIGHIKPLGPYKGVLEKLIEEKGKDKLVFGVRGFLDPNGKLAEVITYDLLPE